jgi:hypothetical protein
MNEWLDHQQNRNRAALGLIAVGVFFLLNQCFNFFNPAGALWPLFVIGPGAVFLYFAFTGSAENAGLVFPGAIITGTGLILLYQNVTGDWDSWAYIWTLYPAMVGLGLRYNGERTDRPSEIKTGSEMIKWSLVAFAAGFVFFELIIFNGFGNFGLVLIGAGLLWMVMNGNRGKTKHSHSSSYAYNGNGADLKRKREEENALV